ncbi:unnamed protein product [Dicrocoelium dendriticum]|nr:unnamed protein product [Dicrocoelium dendriticum]
MTHRLKWLVVCGVFLCIQFILILHQDILLAVNSFNGLNASVCLPLVPLDLSSQAVDTCFRGSGSSLEAFKRTSSVACRSYLMEVACNVPSLNFNLTSECPHRTPAYKVVHLGCYHVALQHLLAVLLQNRLPMPYCIQFCQQTGARYAFTTAGLGCACSQRRLVSESRTSEQSCSTVCELISMPAEDSHNPKCNETVSVFVIVTGATPIVRIAPAPIRIARRPPETEPPRIVYLLMWHGRGWHQLRRLFRLLYHTRHYYYIHVDSRSNYLFNQASSLSRLYPENVYVTPNRWATSWGATDLLWMILSVMHELVTKFKHWRWNFFINLSGTDMPVRPLTQLTTYLNDFPGKVFLSSSRQLPRFIETQGVNRIFASCDRYMWDLGPRALPSGVVLDGGSDWMVLPHEFVHYAVLSQDPLVSNLKEYFNYTLLPVETFFHVLAQNTRFCDSVVNSALRFIHWDRPRGCECKFGISVDWCGCSPVAFRNQHALRRLCNLVGGCMDFSSSSHAVFFARKFDPTVNLPIINFVASNILGEYSDISTLNTYLENIYSSDVDSGGELPFSWLVGLPALAKLLLQRLKDNLSASGLLLLSVESNLHLQVFAFFNGTEQGLLTDNSSTDLPSIPFPPKLVIQAHVRLSQLRGEPVNVVTETLAASTFSGWLSPLPISSLAIGDIVYLEVSSMFDNKEQLVRNYPRLYSSHDQLQLIVFWKGKPFLSNQHKTDSHIIRFLLETPRGVSCASPSPMTLNNGPNTQSAYECETCLLSVTPLTFLLPNCSLVPGAWHLTVFSESGQKSHTSFFLLPTDAPVSPVHLAQPSSPWSDVYPLSYCFIQSTPLGDVKSLEVVERLNCRNQIWSSFAPDPKSELVF